MNAKSSISPQELAKKLNAGEGIVVLDVMPAERFQEVHIKGAVNVCVYEVIFADGMSEKVPDKQKPIVVYSMSAVTQEAEVAVEKLTRLGYVDLTVLEGGIAAWCAADLPLEGASQGACTVGSSYALQDGEYNVDIEKSSIAWAGRNANSRHFGALKFASGQIRVQGGKVTGNCTVDMRSMLNFDLQDAALNAALIHHLSSDDFFFVEKYPTAAFTFSSDNFLDVPAGAKNTVIRGDMHICALSAPVEFPATILPRADGGIAAEAHFDVDRTQFGVIYGCARFFEHLGMHLVYEAITLDVTITAV
jgi:rhodanese-related sulfurtransferase